MDLKINNDRKHLKLLSIFHYIAGGIICVFSLISLPHLLIGISMIISPESFQVESTVEPLPEEFKYFGYFFALLGGLFFVLGETLGISTILSGRFLKKRCRYWFSFITACILCVFAPLGTVLGVFTIIVLSRESVKELYKLS